MALREELEVSNELAQKNAVAATTVDSALIESRLETTKIERSRESGAAALALESRKRRHAERINEQRAGPQ